MGDPELYRGEQVLLRTPGVHVKSIPFEGILTNMRIILVDRAKNILPTREVAYDMIMEAEIGENAIGDEILTLTVQTATGENRQMILTFPQRQGGTRSRERDEWVRIIQQEVSAARNAAVHDAVTAPQTVSVRRSAPAEAYESPAPEDPAGASPDEIVYCTKCGNRVLTDSAFCNKCGTPIVAPAPASRQAPPPARSPAYEKAAAGVPMDSPRSSQPPAASPATPPQKPAKKGFLSGILGGGKKKAAPRPAVPAPARRPRRSMMPGKNVIMGGIIVIVLIVLLAAAAFVVLPMLSSGPSSEGEPTTPGEPVAGETPSGSSAAEPSRPLSNTGVASITVKETTAPTVPVSGVWVMINYIGSYKGTYGMSSDLQKLEDSGSRLYEVVNATGTVQADVEKKDSSTKHELSVAIYKDGALLKSDATKESYGKVSISADAGS
ncbi:zinc-ribbon domain-containing protein [Methanoregula sp.]|uniref:zinc ribbon domain-containing protein n=1 Tax=Methanoregula sp. TaxID=2052170 RepID=UPI002616F162|nr:zinc-ribbon domain-containing protein [Methanoregula sp.]MDD5142841.1 zinc-ribbon domain-containing protein [Methanoregula sp.]